MFKVTSKQILRGKYSVFIDNSSTLDDMVMSQYHFGLSKWFKETNSLLDDKRATPRIVRMPQNMETAREAFEDGPL